MRYKEGDEFLVNGWTTSMSTQPPEFIHRMVVSEAESSIQSDGISIRYSLKMVDEDGNEVAEGRTRNYSLGPGSGSLDPIPSNFERVEDGEEAKVDKGRISVESMCPECSSHEKFMWVLGRDSSSNSYPNGEPQCMKCSYTFYDGCIAHLPQELKQKVKERIRSGEATNQLEDWAHEDTRIQFNKNRQ